MCTNNKFREREIAKQHYAAIYKSTNNATHRFFLLCINFFMASSYSDSLFKFDGIKF